MDKYKYWGPDLLIAPKYGTSPTNWYPKRNNKSILKILINNQKKVPAEAGTNLNQKYWLVFYNQVYFLTVFPAVVTTSSTSENSAS